MEEHIYKTYNFNWFWMAVIGVIELAFNAKLWEEILSPTVLASEGEVILLIVNGAFLLIVNGAFIALGLILPFANSVKYKIVGGKKYIFKVNPECETKKQERIWKEVQ